MKHTPGPWHVEPLDGRRGEGLWIGNMTGGMVAQVIREDGLDEMDHADARLIAAAPELLEALRAVLSACPPENYRKRGGFLKPHLEQMIRAAIAKATQGPCPAEQKES